MTACVLTNVLILTLTVKFSGDNVLDSEGL